jgi:hypothetical protein
MPIASIHILLLSLAAVLGLVVLIGYVVRASGLAARVGNGGGRLAVEQSLALDPRRWLHLVRCDDRHVLLLTGGGADLVVGWVAATRANGEWP